MNFFKMNGLIKAPFLFHLFQRFLRRRCRDILPDQW